MHSSRAGLFLILCFHLMLQSKRALGCVRLSPRNTGPLESQVSVNHHEDHKRPTDTPKISVQDSMFIDDQGRTKIFHGFNAVEKGFPWYPEYLLNDARLHMYQSWGFNVVRLGVMWAGLEPAEGKFNETYLSILKDIVSKLQERRIYVVLDMHQDVLSSRFQSYDGIPLWIIQKLPVSPHPYPWPLPRIASWTDGYLTEAVGMAFQGLYDNYNGTQDSLANFWSKVATAFKDFDNVLGYELINEPWAGDIYSQPSRLAPGVAGRENLLPMYDRLNSAIRQVDTRTILFFEPTTWGIFLNGQSTGSGFDRVPGGTAFSNRSALATHYYCWFMNFNSEHKAYSRFQQVLCDNIIAPKVFEAIVEDGHRIQSATFLTEFGKCDPDGSPHSSATIECVLVMRLADDNLMSWSYWDSTFFYPNGSINWVLTSYFSRPYAQTVAGVPLAMDFDVDTKIFNLKYQGHASIKGDTEIYIPNFHYPRGIDVVTTLGMSWTYEQPQQMLFVRCKSVNACPGIINVYVTKI